MKKFLCLFALAGLICLASTSVAAQDAVRNNTACSFTVKVGYGPIASCTPTGYITATVAPFTQINLGVPFGNEIIIAKGDYTASIGTCPFYIGLPCSIYPLTNNVICGVGCGNYTATLIPGFGISLV